MNLSLWNRRPRAGRVAQLCAVGVAIAGLIGCGAATSSAAQAAYDACHLPDYDGDDLLRINGKTVSIEIKGDTARIFNQGTDAADSLKNTGEIGEGEMEGLGVMFRVMAAANCLVDETSYPGDAGQLSDGDEWEGWSYSEDSGAGSEFSMHFTAK